MTSLFTILCQYKGGAYTHQLRAPHPQAAFQAWAAYFKQDGILTESEVAAFEEEVHYSLAEVNLVALEGLRNSLVRGFYAGRRLAESDRSGHAGASG